MSKQINKKVTKLVRIDSGWHKTLKILAARQETTIKGLIEASLADYMYELKGSDEKNKE